MRFGLVGTGAIAALHAAVIAGLDDAALVACHSRTPEARERFARDNGCDAEATLDGLLGRGDVDVVVITTPSGTHADIGIRAARHGKHVLCEKPLDVSPARADALIAACAEAGVLLGVIYQGRFGAGARALKRAVDAGRFGRIAQCSVFVPWFRDDAYYAGAAWRGTAADDGGSLMNQGSHALDLLLWIAGDVAVASARVQTRMHDIEAEDNAVAWLEFESGSLGLIQCSTACYPGAARRLEVRGETGSVVLADDVPVLWEFAVPTPDDADVVRLAQASAPPRTGEPTPASQSGHLAQYRDFIAALAEGRPPAIPGSEARRSVRLIAALHESNRSGLPVRL
ncbi:Gfo/Idh/MocA family protein [Cryobacterium tepidiphilum]|uniref:Gfo/Idh/MocA family oxidoreductase n=1 Tax=Cryobacterium tepidiphilum TaxID=2486026 RepID=A0A3M8LPX7_9MICO|nr:Gfo/Idh/MocA family oxidoreductase [Cryobacterium tepidiphilum]RNE67431.1 gfo/Idh/MocA family oxidoreductase [Cryobacterium tepidiphilum]